MSKHSLTLGADVEGVRAGQQGHGHAVDEGEIVAGTDSSAEPTTVPADEVLNVLHQALQAAQSADCCPLLDNLAGTLRRLFDHCHANAVRLADIEFEQGAHPLGEGLCALEIQRARTMADAVHAVWKFVEQRALGDLAQRELDASWLRLWASVACPPRTRTGA